MDPQEPLVLRYEGLGERLEALFASLERDPSLQEQFVTNPASFLQGLADEESPPTTQADVNRLLFSVLRSDDFLRWAEEFSRTRLDDVRSATELGGPLTLKGDPEQLFREVADALVRYGDPGALARLAGADIGDVETIEGVSGAVRLPPLPKPVNVNVNINVNITATVVVILLAIAVIPVAVIGRVPRAFARPELRQVAEVLADRLVAEARRPELGA